MNKISNPKVEVSNDKNMNEKDYLNLCLSYLKDLEKNLTICLTEASNEKLYKTIYDIFENINKLQRKIYNLIFKYGWYELEKLNKTQINNQYNKLLKEFETLQ